MAHLRLQDEERGEHRRLDHPTKPDAPQSRVESRLARPTVPTRRGTGGDAAIRARAPAPARARARARARHGSDGTSRHGHGHELTARQGQGYLDLMTLLFSS